MTRVEWIEALREPKLRAGREFAVHQAAGVVAYAIHAATRPDGDYLWNRAIYAASKYADRPGPNGLPTLAAHLSACLIHAELRQHGPARIDTDLDRLAQHAITALFPTGWEMSVRIANPQDAPSPFAAGLSLHQHIRVHGYGCGVDDTARNGLRQLANFATSHFRSDYAVSAAPLYRAGIGVARRHRELVAPVLDNLLA